MTRIIKAFNLSKSLYCVHALFKGSNFIRRNPPIESPKIAEHPSVDLFDVREFRRRRAAIHDTSRKPWLMNRELQGHAAAQRPNMSILRFRSGTTYRSLMNPRSVIARQEYLKLSTILMAKVRASRSTTRRPLIHRHCARPEDRYGSRAAVFPPR